MTLSPQALCPVRPASVAACTQVHQLAATASSDHGELLAYERTNPIVVRASDLTFDPSQWYSSRPNLGPALGTAGVRASWQLKLSHPLAGYQLWLGGTFSRGFEVTVDGRDIGGISDALNPVGAYERVGAPLALSAGRHTITVIYHGEDPFAPGSADTEVPTYDQLTAVALAPPASGARYLTVAAAKASQLCGRTLDWIEIIAPR